MPEYENIDYSKVSARDRALTDPKFYTQSLISITDKDRRIIPFIFNAAQNQYYDSRTRRDCILKPRQMGFCLDPSTRILTEKLEWCCIKDTKIGDKIIVADEFPNPPAGRKLRIGVIEGKSTVYEESFKIIMEDGRELIATGGHRFLCKRVARGWGWKEVRNLTPYDHIRTITQPWNEGDGEDGWFGGLIDAEGSFNDKNGKGICLSISQKPGKLLDEMISYVKRNKYTYRIDTNKNGVCSINLERINDVLRLLGQTRPTRFINQKWWDGRGIPNKPGWSYIKSIEQLPKQEMIDLQTSTGTYIAEGFVSHNSTEILALFLHDTITCPNTVSIIVCHTQKDSAALFERSRFMLESIPAPLRPRIKYSNRLELYFDKINSTLTIGSAETRDFGRGRTINNLHCLHPNTLILKKNGFVEKIETVGIPTIQWDGDLFSVYVRNNPNHPIIVTPDHLLLTKNGWKKAESLTLEDKIAQPKKIITEQIRMISLKIPIKKRSWMNKKVDLTKILENRGNSFYSRLPQRYYWKGNFKQSLNLTSNGCSLKELADIYGLHYQTVRRYIRNALQGVGTKIVDYRYREFPLTKEFGWIVGLMLAEGTVTQKSIQFALHRKEISFSEKIKKFFRENFIASGNKPDCKNKGVWEQAKGNRRRVVITNAVWAKFFREKFYLDPNKGNEKYLPDWVFDAPKEFCSGIVEGMIDGDGYDNPNKMRNEYTSKRPQLATQLRDLICALGYGWSSLSNRKRTDLCRGKRKNSCYSVGLYGITYSNFRNRDAGHTRKPYYEIGEGYVYQNIRDIKKVYYKGQLYDMINQPNNQFRTVAGIVHNCSEVSSQSFTEDFLIGLLESVPRSGHIVMESTARGEGGPFYDYYMGAKNPFRPQRRVKNEYSAHFFLWHDHKEYRINDLSEGQKAEILATLDEEELSLIDRFGLCVEQLAWRREKKFRMGIKFVQEYPEDDDEEVFLKSGTPVFDNIKLSQRDKELVEQFPAEIWLGGDLYIYKMAQPGSKYVLGCLPDGEKVQTSNGLKDIEKVDFADKLYDNAGVEVGIKNIQKRFYEGDIISIRPHHTWRDTSFTPNHLLLVLKDNELHRNWMTGSRKNRYFERFYNLETEWKKAGDIKANDILVYPIKQFKELNNNEILKYFPNQNRVRIDRKIKPSIILEEDFWFLMGVWLAEGYIDQDTNGVVFCLGSHEIELINRSLEIIRKLFNRKGTLSHKGSSTQISFDCETIHNFIKNNFGQRSCGKNFKEWIKRLPKSLKLKLFEGYLKGDGCFIKDGRRKREQICCVSVSSELLENFQDILLSLGFISSVTIARKEGKVFIINRVCQCREKYNLTLSARDSYLLGKELGIKMKQPRFVRKRHKSCSFIKDGYWYIKINELNKNIYSGFVNNFETEKHSYLCSLITVHNCDVAEGDPHSDYSAAMVLKTFPLPMEQVALLVGRWTPDIFSEKIWKLGRAYNNALLAVERNNHGHAVLLNLTNGIVRRGAVAYPPYPNVYVGPDKKVGWLTSNLSKPQMIDLLDRAMRTDEIVSNSKRFIEQAKRFSYLAKMKMGGSQTPDDIVMANAIALIASTGGEFMFDFA